MSKSNLYKRMNPEEIKKGAVYALFNAYQLFGDALIMDSLDRTPRVYALTKLAFEEAAKSIMLLELYYLKKSNTPNFETSIAFKTITEGLEDHNKKTDYAIKFLIVMQKQAILFHPGKLKSDSPLHEELKKLEALLLQVKQLDNQKNTSLYTAIHSNKFYPPSFKIDRQEIQNFIYRTEELLIRAKREIITDTEEYYESIGMERELKKIDLMKEAKVMQQLISGNRAFRSDMKLKYPHLNL